MSHKTWTDISSTLAGCLGLLWRQEFWGPEQVGGQEGSSVFSFYSLLPPALGFLRGWLWSYLVLSSANIIYFSDPKIFSCSDALPGLSFLGVLPCTVYQTFFSCFCFFSKALPGSPSSLSFCPFLFPSNFSSSQDNRYSRMSLAELS